MQQQAFTQTLLGAVFLFSLGGEGYIYRELYTQTNSAMPEAQDHRH